MAHPSPRARLLGGAVALLGLGLGAAAAPRPAAADGYEVFDLGIGANGAALQVNEAGTVSGNHFPGGAIVAQPFVWQRGTSPRLATLPLLDSDGAGGDDDTGGQTSRLAADGRIAGWVTGPGGRERAVAWQPGADGSGAYDAVALPGLELDGAPGVPGLTSGATAFAAAGSDIYGHASYPGAGAALGERVVRWRRSVGPDGAEGPYQVEDLFLGGGGLAALTLGEGWLARVVGVDAAGRVYALATLGLETRVVVWTESAGAREIPLPVAGAPILLPDSVNDQGEVVVNALVGADTNGDGTNDALGLRAFYWRDGAAAFVDLLAPAGGAATGPATGNSFAYGIDDDGVVTGFHLNGVFGAVGAGGAGDPLGASDLAALGVTLTGFVWRAAAGSAPASLVELPGLHPQLDIVFPGFGRSASGSLAGAAITALGSSLHAVRWDEAVDGSYAATDIWAECGVFDPSRSSAATFVNAPGRIVGVSAPTGADLFAQRAFAWLGSGTFLDLTPSGAFGSTATHLTDSGWVLGQWSVPGAWGGSFVAAPLAGSETPTGGGTEAPGLTVDLCRQDTVTLSLGDAAPASVTIAASDVLTLDPASFGAGVTVVIEPDTFDCAAAGVQQPVTVTVTDLCGHVQVCTALVEVVDASPPTIACPPDVSLEVGSCFPPSVALGQAAASDNCTAAGDLAVAHDAPASFDFGVTVVTWTASDEQGNAAECQQTVTITSTADPEIICSPAVAVHTGSSLSQSAFVADSLLQTATVTCGNPVVTSTLDSAPRITVFSGLGTPITGYDLSVGIYPVTWTVTDTATGRSASCQQLVVIANSDGLFCNGLTVVLDGGEPVVVAPEDFVHPSSSFEPVEVVASPTRFGCEDAGAVKEVLVAAADADGNVARCFGQAFVVDAEPAAACRSAIVRLDANGQGALAAADLDAGSALGCEGTLALSQTAFDASQVGYQEVTLTASRTNPDGSTTSSACTSVVLVLAAGADPGPLYEVVDLGVSEVNSPLLQNEAGQVLGRTGQQAFLWEDGTVVRPSDSTFAGEDLNAAGLVAGWIAPFIIAQTVHQPVLWNPATGALTPLGSLGWVTGLGQAQRINDKGQVAGWSARADGLHRGFFWERTAAHPDGHMTEIEAPGVDATFIEIVDLGANGHVVGRDGDDGFFWAPGGVREVLVAPDGAGVRPRSVNARGQVLAEDPNGSAAAYVFQAGAGIGSGAAVVLGSLGGAGVTAVAMDDLGRVVGSAADATGVVHVALWQVDLTTTGTVAPTDLGTLGGPVAIAAAIGPTGRVAGAGVTRDLRIEPFTWKDGVQDLFWNACGNNGLPIGLDAADRVAGRYGAGGLGASPDRAFVYAAPALLDLMPTGGTEAEPRGINQAGQIVGTWETSDVAFTPRRAFVARPIGAAAIQGTLAVAIPNEVVPAEVVCRNATVAIDDAGQATLAASMVVESTTCGTTLTIARTGSQPGAGGGAADSLTFGCDDLGAPVSVTVTATGRDGLTATCTAFVTVVRASYEVIDLGPGMRPIAANEQGQVLLFARDQGTSSLWDAVTRTPTPIAPESAYVEARALSASGVVAGAWIDPDPATNPAGRGRAFVWANGVATSLVVAGGAGGDASAAAIVDDGSGGVIVAGSAYLDAQNPGSQVAFVWKTGDAAITPIGSLGGGSIEVLGLNAAGMVHGHAYTAEGFQRVFFWQAGMPGVIDLGTFGGNSASTFDVNADSAGRDRGATMNASGQIVGVAETAEIDPATGNPALRGFVWTPGDPAITDLDPNRSGLVPLALNDAGVVVGQVGGTFPSAAFVYRGGPGVDLLDAPPPPAGHFGFATATAVNEQGDVVGAGGGIGQDADGNLTGEVAALVWSGGAGTPVDLDAALGEDVAIATHLADDGTVFGQAIAIATQLPRAFAVRNGVVSDISPPGALISQVTGFAEGGLAFGTWQDFSNEGGFVAVPIVTPVIPLACQDLTVPLDGSGEAVIDEISLLGALPEGVQLASVTVTPSTFGCADVGATVTVTLTATDGCGNPYACTAEVTVVDDEDPTIVCPGPVEAAEAHAGAIALGTPLTADNCAVASVTHDAPATFAVGTTTVTWTVADTSGRTASCTQQVTVTDDAGGGGPEIACPADVTAALERGVDDASPTATGAATASAGATVTFTDAIVTSTDGCALAIVRTFTATDTAGRTATCSQTIALADTQKPGLAFEPDLADATVRSCDPVPAPPSAAAFDLAEGDLTQAIVFAEQTLEVGPNDVIIRTWTVGDACGNTATRAQTITVDRASDCVRSQGYWKNHPTAWPANADLVAIPGWTAAGLPATGVAARQLLQTPPRGDATIILAHQLVAALLNVWSGACPLDSVAAPASDRDRQRGWYYGRCDDDDGGAGASTPAATAIAQGVGLLATYPVGSSPRPSAVRSLLTGVAGLLDDFNNGKLGTPKCGDGDDGCAQNRTPVVTDVMASTTIGTSIALDLLAAATDADGEALSVLYVSDPGSGSVEVDAAGRVVYTPAPGFRGADSFAFAVGDRCGGLASGAACVTVAGDVPPPPPTPDCTAPIDACVARSQVSFRSSGQGIAASFEGRIDLGSGHVPADLRGALSAPGALAVRFGEDGAAPVFEAALDFHVRQDDCGRERWTWCGPDGARAHISWSRTRRYTSWRDSAAPRSMGRLSTLFISEDETRFRYDWSSASLPVTIAIDGIPLVTVTTAGVASAFPHSAGESHVDVTFPAELLPGSQVDAYRDGDAADGLGQHVYGHACGADGNASDTYVGAGGCFWIEVPVASLSSSTAPRRATAMLTLGAAGETACGGHVDLAVPRYVRCGRLWFFQGSD